MQGSGRPDIVNAGSGETRYSECRVLGLVTLSAMGLRDHSNTFIQGRTDHLSTRALPEGPGCGQGPRGPMIPYCPGAP
ncbi:unnamed protein product [Staurois parvus]|uniref:Uncharacterized protein n=1 Tax=Staurois parvus TaxID=386267 RepID=A0ABN9FBM9_9NEOB|nr:unnamed protein product [Staurois parvus]